MHTKHFDEINEKFRHDCTYFGTTWFLLHFTFFVRTHSGNLYSLISLLRLPTLVENKLHCLRLRTLRWCGCAKQGGDKWTTQKRTIKWPKKCNKYSTGNRMPPLKWNGQTNIHIRSLLTICISRITTNAKIIKINKHFFFFLFPFIDQCHRCRHRRRRRRRHRLHAHDTTTYRDHEWVNYIKGDSEFWMRMKKKNEHKFCFLTK